MVRQQFDFLDIAHIAGKFTEAMRGVVIVRPARYNNVADPDLNVFIRQVFREFQRTVIRNAHQILMNFIIHLFEIEHHQVSHFQQLINHRIVTANKAISIKTGMNALFFAGAEPVADKLCL